jgi:hypothetical protein
VNTAIEVSQKLCRESNSHSRKSLSLKRIPILENFKSLLIFPSYFDGKYLIEK